MPLTIAQVRELTGDTTSSPFQSDAEIQSHINAAPTNAPYYAVYLALQSLAIKLSIQVGQVSTLGYTGDGITVANQVRQYSRQFATRPPVALFKEVTNGST